MAGPGRQVYTVAEKFSLQELIIKYKLNSTGTITAGNPAAKKRAWQLLTEEFNSIETNTRRTEPQLRKLWDNLKTRQKQILNLEKRNRMRTGGGPYNPEPSTSAGGSTEEINAALLEPTDTEIRFAVDSDTGDTIYEIICEEDQEMENAVLATSADSTDVNVPDGTQPGPSQETQTGPSEERSGPQPGPSHNRTGSRTGHRSSGSRVSESDNGLLQAPGARNIRARVIQDEFSLRQANYGRAQEREQELHHLKRAEQEWLVKAAQEKFKTAEIERQCAEEQLLCIKVNREAVELNFKKLKDL